MEGVIRVSRVQTLLKERAAESLRQAILNGVFLPGQKLVERELCEQLDVSRSCVREALQHLQSEGLIKIIPHKGPEVAAISEQEVVQLYAVRRKLEGLIGASFCVNATAEDRDRLRNKVKELTLYLNRPDHPNLLQLKNEFYAILAQGSGNDIAGAILRQLNNRVMVFRRISMAQKGRLEQTIKELEEIIEAIEVRDAALVEKLCEEHVERAGDALLQAI